MDPVGSDKQIRLRYAGTCRPCGEPLPAGGEAIYERNAKTVRCVECRMPAEPQPDVAGGSARREYERRKSAREDRIRASHPKLGGLILALSDDPQSTRAWERGAVGEELLGERLKDLPATARVLHDRRNPGTRANIDHIVVTPAGVWVIDAKRYKSKRPELHVEGGILRPRTESLRVGGRDASKLVSGVASQVDRVAGAVADDAVTVTGVLCFLEADWPLIGGSFEVNGIHVLWPRLLIKRITAESTPDPIDPDVVSGRLAAAFPRHA
ncbi:hypothetical protein GCM10022200_07580 [Microbacterium awajiense]|uniref:NERD domain-containing protein n=1 Tax=Microbacterium awajiense TaxID=415214 RepID=A0ABP7A9P2_9MICO